MLNTFEALFILALDDERGDLLESATGALEPALAGAVLAELTLAERIELKEGRIIVIDQMPLDHPILDGLLFEIVESIKPRKLKYWVNTLSFKKIREEIGHYLVEKGILVRNKKRLNLVAPHGEEPESAVSAQYTLKAKLREVVLAGKLPNLSEKALLAFLFRIRLLKLVFTAGERRSAYKRVKELIVYAPEEVEIGAQLDEILAATCEERKKSKK